MVKNDCERARNRLYWVLVGEIPLQRDWLLSYPFGRPNLVGSALCFVTVIAERLDLGCR